MRVFRTVYDDASDKAAADAAADAANTPKTYTQKELDDHLAAQKTNGRKQQDALILQLEELKNIKSLSEKEKGELQTQIETLQNQNLTKEELAKRELKKKDDEYNLNLTKAQQGEKVWQGRFVDKVVEVDIHREASAAGAYRNSQIYAQLKPLSRTVELTGEDGKLNGTFQTRINYPSKDKDGTTKTLDLTVAEAIKMMKEDVEYANMFIVEGTGGVGGSNNGEKNPVVKKVDDLLNMSDEQYQAHRKKNPGLI